MQPSSENDTGDGRSGEVGGWRAAAVPVAAGVGAHQPDRRLCLAAEPQAGGREVSAAKAARKTLAYDFFRFLYSPHLTHRDDFTKKWKLIASIFSLEYAFWLRHKLRYHLVSRL